ncbi:MAG: leucine--tRNA ligase [Candidatus Vogelbacteria bacterium]|nr:leucine--tRNA ligase [Candidatus Vogelbacteria bacterium]
MEVYDHKRIEQKWQKIWREGNANRATTGDKKPKYYPLVEFPYPSGEGLHVGHIRSYTAMDIIARKRRAEGYNVLYPIGWDAFGLPTENYALKTGTPPQVVTKQNTDNFRRQIQMLGLSFDWSREINTTDPNYYKWTQWIFLQLFKHGLAYKKKLTVNWCPKDKIVLANEEVVDGKCERCGTAVVEREKEQWLLAITKYADRLDRDLDLVDYLPQIKTQQRNWIGRSEGAVIKFDDVEVFTTRPETIFGATFIAVAGKEDRFTDRYVINPATGEPIPVWEAEYVLGDVGTGAIMGVPAHDERDFEFAKKHGLAITDKPLIDREEAIKKFGQSKVTYKLRDWVFSRQRYWGEPIPIVFCEKPARPDGRLGGCGPVPVPEEQLPVILPEVERYQPTETGESPLANITDWVNTKCPKCGGRARRETDTMPNWAGSSWYYIAYCISENLKSEAPISKQIQSPEIQNKIKYWLPVDWYNGGMEHTTLHLLYSRFWHKFLFDIAVVPTPEPYAKRTAHGLILAADGEKMSKSKGNVINPDEIVERYGADTLRVYEMFLGPFDQSVAWSTASIIGPRRFLEKVWRLSAKLQNSKGRTLKDAQGSTLGSLLNQTIKKVSDDIEAMKFNTAVSSLMILVNTMEELPITQADYETLLKLLAPFAPHIAEELWHNFGYPNSIHLETWPRYDAAKITTQKRVIIVQVNGVRRDTLTVTGEPDEKEMKILALKSEKVTKWLSGAPQKVFYVSGRLINLVA